MVAESSCCVTTSQKRLMVFSGRSNPVLGEKIAEKLGINLGGVLLKTFANGEIYARFDESIRGADAFIVQSPKDRLNDEVMELLIMIQAARLASARRRSAGGCCRRFANVSENLTANFSAAVSRWSSLPTVRIARGISSSDRHGILSWRMPRCSIACTEFLSSMSTVTTRSGAHLARASRIGMPKSPATGTRFTTAAG